MVSFLTRVLDLPDRPTRLSRKADRREFAAVVARTQLTFLSVPVELEAGLDADTMTPEDLLDCIEKSARLCSEREAHPPWTCVRAGELLLPVFSQKRYAERFVGEYVKSLNRVIPFFLLTASGRDIAASAAEGATVLLNAGTRHEYRLTRDDLAAVRAAAA